jgi:hypothetical protein
MEPPSKLQQEYAVALAERAALRRKVRALENKNAVLQACEVELEWRLAESAVYVTASVTTTIDSGWLLPSRTGTTSGQSASLSASVAPLNVPASVAVANSAIANSPLTTNSAKNNGDFHKEDHS